MYLRPSTRTPVGPWSYRFYSNGATSTDYFYNDCPGPSKLPLLSRKPRATPPGTIKPEPLSIEPPSTRVMLPPPLLRLSSMTPRTSLAFCCTPAGCCCCWFCCLCLSTSSSSSSPNALPVTPNVVRSVFSHSRSICDVMRKLSLECCCRLAVVCLTKSTSLFRMPTSHFSFTL